MPTLTWVGKEKVIHHHRDVPYRVLNKQYHYEPASQRASEPASQRASEPASQRANWTSSAPPGSADPSKNLAAENRIIHGDNLEALKSLLPEFEGRVNCIYIDPPYNTGNEGWVYNDAVNDPKIKKWLGQVVGPEGEDLSRHDKWLCMMYPRLKLLHRLLSSDGVIFVSIDDNEVQHLRPLLDEIFGISNRIEQFIWKKSYGGGAKERYAITVHEYILMYAKNIKNVKELSLPPDTDAEARYYKLTDEKVAVRGPFRIKPLEATKSMDRRENLVYSIPAPDGAEIWPKRQWWWAKERVDAALQDNGLYFTKGKSGGWTVSYKQYLRDEDGDQRRSKPFSIIDGIYTQVGSALLRNIFSDNPNEVFQFPKPVELIERLLAMLQLPKNAIILDSFGGSATTAHAVLNLNMHDKAQRQFILIEQLDYAETITAERIRRVINGYGEDSKAVAGLGGSFDYYTVGERLLLDDGMLNPSVGLSDIRNYVAWTEGIPIGQCAPLVPAAEEGNASSPYWLGETHGLGLFFVWDDSKATTLDLSLLTELIKQPGRYLIYADQCALGEDFMRRHGIVYKKIPRDITRL